MIKSSFGETKTYDEALEEWLVINGSGSKEPVVRTQGDITKSCLYPALKYGSNIKYIKLVNQNHDLIKVSRSMTEHLKWKAEENGATYIDVELKSRRILTIVL